MKKTFSILLISLLALSVSAQEKQEKKVKTGWKWDGALPAITYDSDLGFQYGALVEFSNYGDGSTYPEFIEHIYAEVSRFTKGSGIYRIMYQTRHLIPGVYMVTDLSYLPDQANHFYGFNGYEAVFNKPWMDEEDPGYRTRMFYRYNRNQFRFKNDFEGKLAGKQFKWNAGFAFNNFNVGSVDIERLNKNKDVPLPSTSVEPGLFEMYRDSLGLISADEANGGWVNTLKFGVSFDTRDNFKNPMKGIWTEMGIEVSPKFIGSDWGFSRFYITHRQYFTLIPKNLSFVYRLGYQSTISGGIPFFYQSQMITSILTGATNEGLGGSSSLRGVVRNRVIGDGFILGNIEFRWKPLYFRFLNEDCYLGLDAFYDFGMVTKKIALPANLQTTFNNNLKNETYSDFFNPGAEKLHQSAGMSVMLARGPNFVIAVDIGKAFNVQDGNIGFSVGLNYLF
jgi:outer membrane protein assembly factor BamA